MPVVIAIGAFLSVLLLIMGGYYYYDHSAYGDQTTTVRRLRAAAEMTSREAVVEIVRRDMMGKDAWYTVILSKYAPLAAIKRLLKQSDSEMPVSVFLLMTGLAAMGGLLAGMLVRMGALTAVGCMAGGSAIPWLYFRWRRNNRLKAIEAQLPEVLDLIARTLMAGHAYIMGMKMVAEQMDEPIRSEFQKAFDEISFGISVPEAMKDMAERIDSVDIKFFVTSLLVQLETGGNLAEIIQGIARLIRARFELHGKVRALSAEGRISAMVMFALPFGIGLAMYSINSAYISLLFTDPAGRSMIAGGLLMMILGLLVTRRMINFKV